MAQLNLRVKNTKLDQMLDSVLKEYGQFPYQANIPNPAYHPNQWLDAPTNTVPDPLYDPNQTILNPVTKQATVEALLEDRILRPIWDNWARQAAIAAALATVDQTSPIA